MRCNYDNLITLKALNLMYRDSLLGDTSQQDLYLELLLQLTRYFVSGDSQSNHRIELENLRRAVTFLLADKELQSCRMREPVELVPASSVERFSEFDACLCSLFQLMQEGKTAVEIFYSPDADKLMVKVLEQPC